MTVLTILRRILYARVLIGQLYYNFICLAHFAALMVFYDHDDRTIIETDASSRWLPGLSLEALKLAFSASGDGWGGHPGRRIRFIDEIALHSDLLYTVFNTLRPRQDGCLFADDILKCIFLNGNS